MSVTIRLRWLLWAAVRVREARGFKNRQLGRDICARVLRSHFSACLLAEEATYWVWNKLDLHGIQGRYSCKSGRIFESFVKKIKTCMRRGGGGGLSRSASVPLLCMFPHLYISHELQS